MNTIPSIVHDIAKAAPDREAVVYRNIETGGDSRLSYGQLWSKAASISAMLEDLPVGGHVMLVAPVGLDLLACHLGVMQAAMVPSIFSHPSEKTDDAFYLRRLGHALTTVRPDAVIVARAFVGAVKESMGDREIPIYQLGEERLNASEPQSWRNVDADSPAIIQYSSGSTGMQKGLSLSHAMVLGQCDSLGAFIDIDPEHDTICSWLPLYHDMGLFTSWLIPLVKGVRVVIIDPFQWVKQPASFLKLISEFRGTLAWMPNFSFNLMAMRPPAAEEGGIDLSCMRGIVNCSEPVAASSMQRFAEAMAPLGFSSTALWVCYAMAENSFAVTGTATGREPYRTLMIDAKALSEGRCVPGDGADSIKIVSCGVPIDNCQIQVVDNERQVLDDGRVGEIAVRSPFTFVGYIDNPQATAAALQDGWCYTGDLGFLHESRLYITGRNKDLLIVGGRNFYPQDIERICDSFEGTVPGRSVAIGVDEERTGTQKVVLLVEANQEADSVQPDLTSDIRTRVFAELDCAVSQVYLVPRGWLIKTSSGKIARQPNLERYIDEFGENVPERPEILAPAKKRLPMHLHLMVSAMLAGLIYLQVMIQEKSISWGVYANF